MRGRGWRTYTVFYSSVGCLNWKKTHFEVRARNDKEAQIKMRKMFASAGLANMSLVASLEDLTKEAT